MTSSRFKDPEAEKELREFQANSLSGLRFDEIQEMHEKVGRDFGDLTKDELSTPKADDLVKKLRFLKETIDRGWSGRPDDTDAVTVDDRREYNEDALGTASETVASLSRRLSSGAITDSDEETKAVKRIEELREDMVEKGGMAGVDAVKEGMTKEARAIFEKEFSDSVQRSGLTAEQGRDLNATDFESKIVALILTSLAATEAARSKANAEASSKTGGGR